jgi:hypothetical protein
MNAKINAMSDPYVKHVRTGIVYEVSGLAPIGLDVFLECHAFDGSFRLLNQRDTRPATVADWNRQERGN